MLLQGGGIASPGGAPRGDSIWPVSRCSVTLWQLGPGERLESLGQDLCDELASA